jgi:hypothetical protein
MGLFKNLRDSAKAMKSMVAEANAASIAAAANEPLTIIDPTPQPIIDQLLAAGGPARGVVVHASHPPQNGERANKMRVTVRVRARLANGALGDEATHKIWTSWKVAALLDRGLEIPVLVDRSTGAVTDILADDLQRELSSRFDESGRRRPGWTFDPFG